MGTVAPLIDLKELNEQLDRLLWGVFTEKDRASIAQLECRLASIASWYGLDAVDAQFRLQGRFTFALTQGTLTSDQVNGASVDLRHFFGIKA